MHSRFRVLEARDLVAFHPAQEPLAFLSGPDPVRTLGIISGGAQREVYQAIDAGLDAYITGEISEPQTHYARETGVAFIACGHHASERYGAAALTEHVAARFGLAHRFIDIDNPA